MDKQGRYQEGNIKYIYKYSLKHAIVGAKENGVTRQEKRNHMWVETYPESRKKRKQKQRSKQSMESMPVAFVEKKSNVYYMQANRL